MPLYEYQCAKCGERIEVIQRMSDPPPATCTKCGGDMKKLISSPAIQFKGSGFYKTDYASKSSSGSDSKSGSETKSGSDTKSGSETKSESSSSGSESSSTKSETKSE